MAAPKGSQYWKLAKRYGRIKKYTPETLWDTALEYIKWVESNPLPEEKAFGTGKRVTVSKMRAMTIKGFCIFAGITHQTFENYTNNILFIEVVARIREIIFTQKFEGAAAGLLESNIISMELGLSRKQEISGLGGKELFNSPISQEQIDKLIDKL
ncbi:MAG: DNA-packaging protein [Prevotella sp.]|jgi:hypothetical protein|nr:DNA-packaging protein [Prevotella sp.]